VSRSHAVVPLPPAAYFGLSVNGRQRTFAWRTLTNRSFRYYFVGSVTSDFGTWLQNTAQVLLAYRLSHSVLVVGIVTCAQFSSPLVLGPWAGVMTDRFGGRRILVATQLAAAACAALMAALAFADLMHTRWLGCGAIASGLAFTFALPARNVTVRRLVPAGDIRPAFAMDSVSYNLGRAIAPPVSVLLISTMGYGWAFAANSASFLVFVGCLVLAGHGQPPERLERSQLKDGFKVAFHDQRIAVVLLMVAAVTIADDPVLVLGPAVAAHLHVSTAWSGWFIAALGGGTFLGSFRPSMHEPSLRLAATALAILAACMMLFVLSSSLLVTILAAFGAGVMCLVANSATRTVLATQATPAHEASVMAVWAIAWAGSKPVASLSDGLLARHVGIKVTGVLLAMPAMLPIVALVALLVLWLVIQKWKPQPSRLASRRERLTSQKWFQCTTEKMATAPAPTKSVVKAPINAGCRRVTAERHRFIIVTKGTAVLVPRRCPSGPNEHGKTAARPRPEAAHGQATRPSLPAVSLRALRPLRRVARLWRSPRRAITESRQSGTRIEGAPGNQPLEFGLIPALLGAVVRQRFRWTTFDLNDWLPSGWQQAVREAAATADIREFPRTPVLSRESPDVPYIARGRVHADQVRDRLPWLYKAYRNEILELANDITAEDVSAAQDDRYGVVLNVQLGTSMRFECHVDSNPLTGLLFCTDHPVGGELVFAHSTGAAGTAGVDQDCSAIRPHAGHLIFFDARRHPHYSRPLTTASGMRIVAVMNFYTKSFPESTRPPELNQHLYGDA